MLLNVRLLAVMAVPSVIVPAVPPNRAELVAPLIQAMLFAPPSAVQLPEEVSQVPEPPVMVPLPTPIVPGLPVRKASSGYPTYPDDLLSGDKRPAGISSSEGLLVRPEIDLVTPRRAQLGDGFASSTPRWLQGHGRLSKSSVGSRLGESLGR